MDTSLDAFSHPVHALPKGNYSKSNFTPQNRELLILFSQASTLLVISQTGKCNRWSYDSQVPEGAPSIEWGVLLAEHLAHLQEADSRTG